jgi:predicted methyltransferase
MEKIQFFSEETQLLYQLYPTKTIPTLKISGVPMHRFATIDPKTDTERKIAAAKPKGKVLDCCMGLGYTAIFSARLPNVTKVQTFEKDPNVLKIARMNEASNDLFTNQKITVTNEDSSIAVPKLPSNYFDTIIHTLQLSEWPQNSTQRNSTGS